MALEIIFKVIDQLYRLFKKSFIGTAVHKDGLCAKHFRHLSQNGGAALGDQKVGKSSY